MKKKSKIIVVLLVLLVAVGTGTLIYTKDRLKVTLPPTVTASEVLKAKPRIDKSELMFTGTVKSADTYSVTSLVKGRIYEIYVKEGQSVKKGDQLLLIDNRDEIKESRQAWDDAIASVSEIKALSDSTAEELKRETSLFEKKELDATEYQRAIDNVNMANLELEKSVEKSDRAKSKYEVATKNSLVTSPVEGTVGRLDIFKRQEVSGGSALCEIKSANFKYVEISVDARIAEDMYITEPMTLKIGELDYDGSIMNIEESLDKGDVYVVKVIIDTPEGIEDGADAVVRFADATYTKISTE